MGFLTERERMTLGAAVDRLIPPGEGHPGGRALGTVEYIDSLLDAFAVDPPRVWAGGPFSGRAGGRASFARFTPLGPAEELAWRVRIEGSQDRPEREWNGPQRGWQQVYRDGLAALGEDFARVEPDEQDRRLHDAPELRPVLYGHACEACYGDPVYGGNPRGAGWRTIGYPGDSQPKGYTDAEVSEP